MLDSRLSTLSPQLPRLRRAFSLIEVVAAIGIFAVGMIAVLGLYTPIAKSVNSSVEAETAARIAGAIASRLQGQPLANVAALLKTGAQLQANDASPTYNPADGKDTKVMFATAAGEAGIYDPAKKFWVDATGAQIQQRDMFYEVALVRNDALSPAALDNATPGPAYLAFNVRVRWPVFRATADPSRPAQPGAGQTGTVTYDHSQQQVAFFSGSVSR